MALGINSEIITGEKPRDLLKESKRAVNDALRRKKKQLSGGDIDVESVVFESFRIDSQKESDIPSEKLPNNGADGKELMEYINDSNDKLLKYLEEARENKKKNVPAEANVEIDEKTEKDVSVIFLNLLTPNGSFFNEMDDKSRDILSRATRNMVVAKLKESFLKGAKKEELEKMADKQLEEEVRRFCADRSNLEKIATKMNKEELFAVISQAAGFSGGEWKEPEWKNTEGVEDNQIIEGAKDVENVEKIQDPGDIKIAQEKEPEKEVVEIPIAGEKKPEDGQKEENEEKSKNSQEKPKDNDVKIPITGEKKPERSAEKNEELERLMKEIEITRKEYLEIDYEKKHAFNRVYAFFGSAFKSSKEKNLEQDSDVEHYRKKYNNALLKYKEALIEDAKTRKVSDSELVEIATYFDVELKINISNGHNEVKAEKLDGRVFGWMKNFSENYKKMHWSKKLAIGATFAGAMFVGGSVGGAAAVSIGAVAAAKRIVMGMMAGVTTSLWLEKKTEENRKKEINEKALEIGKKLEGLSDEDRYKLLEERLAGVITDKNNILGTIKNKNLLNLAVGAGVGVLLGGGAMEIAEYLKGLMGAGEVVSSGITQSAEAVKEVAGAENLSGAAENLVIEKGSSFEGTLIKYLSNPDAEIYKYHPELKGKNAGWIAHRLALDFANDHNAEMPDLVHPGAEIKINFDPAALKLGGEFEQTIRIDLTDSIDPVEAKNHIAGPFAEVPDVDQVASGNVSSGVEEVANVSGEQVEQGIGKVVAPEKYVWPSEPPIMDDVRIDESGVDVDDSDSINEYKEEERSWFISKTPDNPKLVEHFKEIVSANRKNVCNGDFELFSRIRNMNFSKNQAEIIEGLPKKGRELVQIFLKETPLKKVETFDQWMRRATRISMEKYG